MINKIVLAALAFTAPDMNEIDSFLAADNFSKAFPAGEMVHLERKSCALSQCDTMKFTYLVGRVDEDSVNVNTFASDGSLIQESPANAEDWEKISHNMARAKMRVLSNSGFKPVLESISDSTYRVSVNGNAQEVATKILKIRAESALPQLRVDLEMEIAPGLGATAQVLRSEEKKMGGSDTVEVKSIELPTK